MTWDIPTIISLINEGALLFPKFIQLWNGAKSAFDTNDVQAVEAALRAAIAQDAADTASALADLDAAAQRT